MKRVSLFLCRQHGSQADGVNFALDYPLAARAVNKSFYVDDGLTGADSIEEAITLQRQLQELFGRGGFLLQNETLVTLLS